MTPDIQTLTVEMDPEHIRPAPPALELAPRDDIPVRAITAPARMGLNWGILAVIAVDAVLWGLIVLAVMLVVSPNLQAEVAGWIGGVVL